jgi:hypothetical protein
MVEPTCNPSIQKGKTGGERVRSQPGLHSKFQGSLGCIVRFCILKPKTKNPTHIIYLKRVQLHVSEVCISEKLFLKNPFSVVAP